MQVLELDTLRLKIISSGGIETCCILPEYKIAFDVGRCPSDLVDIPRVFLTHGHLDHTSGLSYYFSQRSLRRLPNPEVFAPKKLVNPLKKILKQWQIIEQFKYSITIKKMKIFEKIKLSENVSIQSLPSFHRIPSQGYVLLKTVKKLKEQFINLSGRKIKELKDKKEDIFYIKEIPVFCVSGDTTIQFLQENEIAGKAEVLVLECTYIDDKRPPERAHQWGHTHLYDIIENSHLFENKHILLCHFSKRYTPKVIEKIMKEKLPSDIKNRVTLIMNS